MFILTNIQCKKLNYFYDLDFFNQPLNKEGGLQPSQAFLMMKLWRFPKEKKSQDDFHI